MWSPIPICIAFTLTLKLFCESGSNGSSGRSKEASGWLSSSVKSTTVFLGAGLGEDLGVGFGPGLGVRKNSLTSEAPADLSFSGEISDFSLAHESWLFRSFSPPFGLTTFPDKLGVTNLGKILELLATPRT